LTPLDVVKHVAMAGPRFGQRKPLTAVEAFYDVRLQGTPAFWTGARLGVAYYSVSNLAFLALYENYIAQKRQAHWAVFWARSWSLLLAAPLDVLRTRYQTLRGEAAPSPYRELRNMMQQDGFSSIWRGSLATWMRDIPLLGVYAGLMTYADKLPVSSGLKVPGGDPLFVLSSAMLATLVTQPFDVVRARQMAMQREISYRNFRVSRVRTVGYVFSTIVDESGYRGLFVGLGARMLRAPLALGIMLAAYEVGEAVSLANDGLPFGL
jgi:hypothetical protein